MRKEDAGYSRRSATLMLFGVVCSILIYLIARDYLAQILPSLPSNEPNASLILESLKSGLYRLQMFAFLLSFVCLSLTLKYFLSASTRPARLLRTLLDSPALTVSLIAVVVGTIGILQNCYVINGKPYFTLFDDAMISMRYARNWANGSGIVWNSGEVVEGYSNFLWLVVMTLVHLLRLPENYTAIPIMVFNWLLSIGLLWLIQAILKRLEVTALWILIVLLCFIADINVIFWANSGMETLLLTFLVTLAVWALFSRRTVPFLLALIAIPLVRSDSFVIAFALGIVFLWQAHLSRKTVILLALSTLPTLIHLWFRVTYYGNVFPNPYYLKVTGSDLLGLSALRYGFRFLTTYGLLSIFLPIAAFLIPRLRAVVLIIFVQVAYFLVIGGDAFQFMRFALPVLPLIYLSVGSCLYRLSKNVDQATRLLAVIYFVVATPLLGDLFAAPNNAAQGWVELGVLIEDNTPPNTLVAISAAGIAPYFAEKQRFVDLLGVNDAHIARETSLAHLGVLGHNKFDFDYVYDVRQPEVIHTNGSCEWVADLLAKIPPQERQSFLQSLPPDQDVHDYFEVLNSAFTQDYLSNPVDMNLAGQRGCLYLRTGSTISRQWNILLSG